MAIALAPTDTKSNFDLGSILQSLPGLLTAFQGKTTTQNESISQDGLNAMLSQILSGTQGLASVAGGQHTAGLYNSTVNTQLTNDLLTRAAGQVSQANKTTTQTVQPQASAGKLATVAGLGGLGLKLLSSSGLTKGKNLNDILGGLLGGGGSASAISPASFGGSAASQFSLPTSAGISGLDSSSAANLLSSFGGVDAGSSAAGGPVANFATDSASGLSAGGALFNAGDAAGSNLSSGVLGGAVQSGDAGLSTLFGPASSAAIDMGTSAGASAATSGAISAGTDAASSAGTSAAIGAGTSAAGSSLGSAVPYIGAAVSAGQDLAQGNSVAAAGTAAGAALGSFFPVVGTAAGAALGNFVGNEAGSWSDVADSTYSPSAILFGLPGTGQFTSHIGGAIDSTIDQGTGVISDALGSIGLGGVGGALNDISDAVGGFVKSVTNCFLTTAMCEYYGKPDNCQELTILRHFRDSYMSSTEERKALVQEYYAIGPGLVSKLESLEPLKKKIVMRNIKNYVGMAIEGIRAYDQEYTLTVYKQLVAYVKTVTSEIGPEESNG